MIAIIDYGVGNLFSLKSSFAAIGADTVVTGDPAVIRGAEKLVLPGVGAFGDAAALLRRNGLDKLVKEEASGGKPLLGICLGMQLLFDYSLEYGRHQGLGLIPGEVAFLGEDLADGTLKVPHMGWNSLEIGKDDPLFKYFKNGEYVYYVHSFYARDCDASTLGTSRYGNVAVTGAVRCGNVWGTQFHPEKSGDAGLGLLRAFAEL